MKKRLLRAFAGLGALMAAPLSPALGLADPSQPFEPLTWPKPPELHFARGWEEAERREWLPSRADVRAWRRDRSPDETAFVQDAFIERRFPHMTDVTFNGADARCLQVLPWDAHVGGVVTVGLCNGLPHQIFRTDRHSFRGGPIMVPRSVAADKGRLLCLDTRRMGRSARGARGALRLAHCDPVQFETGSQFLFLHYPRGLWPRQQPPALIEVEVKIGARRGLCVGRPVSTETVTSALIQACPTIPRNDRPASWIMVDRQGDLALTQLRRGARLHS